jgi:hypothetical protein
MKSSRNKTLGNPPSPCPVCIFLQVNYRYTRRAKEMNRKDLIMKKKHPKKQEKNKSRMKNCLCVTLNPGNPPFRKWLKELTPILHIDPSLRKLIPEIPVVFKQPPSVARIAIKAKHGTGQGDPNNQSVGS